MLDTISVWVRTIAVCAILTEIIDIAFPSKILEEIKPVLSGIILVAAITNISADAYEYTFEETYKLDYSDYEYIDEQQLLEVSRLYEEKVTEYIYTNVSGIEGTGSFSVSVKFENNPLSEDFGRLTEVHITEMTYVDVHEQSGFTTFNLEAAVNRTIKDLLIQDLGCKEENIYVEAAT